MTTTPAITTVAAQITPLRQLLTQLDGLIDALDDPAYADPQPAFMNSAIGQHVRHCLDHFQLLLEALDSGVADYDARIRGTDIETDRVAARQVVAQVRDRLGAMDVTVLWQPVRVRSTMCAGDEPVTCESNVSRELVFLLSHTVHHNALIRVMAEAAGAAVPERFGFAPSTIAHQKAVGSCAR